MRYGDIGPRKTPTRALTLLAMSVTFACSSPAPIQTDIAWRLVDAEASGDAAPVLLGVAAPARARGPSRAVIADEMRYTFARPESRLLYRNQHVAVPSDGALRLEVPLPLAFRDCERVLLRLSLSGATARDARSAVGTCVHTDNTPHVSFSFEAPPVLRGREVDLWIQGQPASTAPSSRRSFRVERVPPGTHLVFSYGVEPVGWEPGSPPATFVIRADEVPTPLFEATVDAARQPNQRRWIDADVDLAAFADRTLTLTLETTVAPSPDASTLNVPVWGNPTIVVDRPATGPRPINVLLVSLDTLRAKSLTAYGRERATAPFFDGLVREGTLFETAIAQSTLTPVSNMSMFSALYPYRHGVTDLRAPADPDRVPTLPERFRAARYATGAITEDGLLQPALGFERGVDDYRENKSADLGSTVGQIERTFDDALRWMQAHQRVPFFLFVQTYQVHSPYTPPPAYLHRFGTDATPEPERSRDRYEEEILYADDWLRKLWTGVEALGLADHTLLVVTSDHGEEFGEHGALDHGSHLYEETLHVPLVLRLPGRIPANLRVRAPVGLIDLAPTLLDLLGLPPLAAADGRTLRGLLSTDPQSRAEHDDDFRTRVLFAEAWAATRMRVDGTLDPAWHAPIYALRSATRKLILTPATAAPARPETLEVYDLATDPREEHPVENADISAMSTDVDALRHYVATATQATPAAQASPAAPTDPATLEKLRALGYVR